MKVELAVEEYSIVTANSLKEMIDNKANISKEQLKAARKCLTYFVSFQEWKELPLKYRKNVSW